MISNVLSAVNRPMKKLSHSVTLVRQCGVVIQTNKTLLCFPTIGILITLVLIVITLAIFQQTFNSPNLTQLIVHHAGVSFGIVFIYSIVTRFLATLLNAATIVTIASSYDGKSISVFYGLKKAIKHSFAILYWVITEMVMPIFFRFSRASKSFSGSTWTVINLIALPTLILEKRSPISAIRQSEKLLTQRWGEALVLSIGFRFMFRMAIICLFVLTILLSHQFAKQPHTILIVIGVFLMITLPLHFAELVLINIWKYALYCFATSATAPIVEVNLLQQAFRSSR